jgi:CPA1 family monovalent cation:H+ antiporter
MAVAISGVVIIARILWVFPATYLPRWVSAGLRERDPYPPIRNVFLVSWAGMRGVVSLAAALALPLTLPSGDPFPGRNLLVFLTFAVILATLVGQGLTLPLVIRGLGIAQDGGSEGEEAHARLYMAEAALARMNLLEKRWPGHGELIERLRADFRHRAEHLDEVRQDTAPETESERELVEHREIRHALTQIEREALLRLHDTGAVSDDVMRRIERDLDLEELRMEP